MADATHRSSTKPKKQSRTMALADARALIGRVKAGYTLTEVQFAWLKAHGLAGGTTQQPGLTARAKQLAQALTSTPNVEADGPAQPNPIRLPDALDRLAYPRKGDAALLDSCDVAAARAFQRDLHIAGLHQRITQSWSLASLTHSGGKGGAGAGGHEAATVLDARARVHKACRAVGPEFSGLLMDVCLFEKPLNTIESERQWPARSAKLAIALGLSTLARFYGFKGLGSASQRA